MLVALILFRLPLLVRVLIPAVVVDVGVNRVEDASRPRGYRLCGDVDFDAVAPKVSAITPVPGGVGPVTVSMLMRNTVIAVERQKEYYDGQFSSHI